MLDVPLTRKEIQGFYSPAASAYDGATLEHEAKAKVRAPASLARRPNERLLEVAVGTGYRFAEQVKASGTANAIVVDLSPGMLATAREALAEAGVEQPPLGLTDARTRPFADELFDYVFNSYMIDLIPTDETATVVAEFWPVLRPGGRLVLVNLTEGEGDDTQFMCDWIERFSAEPIQLGGCQPVVVGPSLEKRGFVCVTREYCGHGESWLSEIVTARKPV